MSPTKLSLAGNNLIIPASESLVSDIPAGDGKTENLLLQCNQFLQCKEKEKEYKMLLYIWKRYKAVKVEKEEVLLKKRALSEVDTHRSESGY
jgi:hypothetical protein